MGNDNSKSSNKSSESKNEDIPPPSTLDSLDLFKDRWEEKLSLRTKRLRAPYLGWQEIPPAVFKKEELESLDLLGNKLTTIPDQITHLTNLTELSVAHNRLGQFPVILEQLPNLKRLSLSYNNFKDANIPFVGFKKLEDITLIGGLDSFPKSFSQLPELKNLNIDLQLQEELDDDVFNGFQNLESLFIGIYTFLTFPSSFFQLKSLTKLKLNTNYIPNEMEMLENLQLLNITSTYFDAKNEFFSYPILNYVLLGRISDCNSFLSLDMDLLLYESLGLFMYKPIVDLSNFKIRENLKVIINGEIDIWNDSELKIKFNKIEMRVPTKLKQVFKVGHHSIVVDPVGNFWFLESDLYRFIDKHHPTRFKRLPNGREYVNSSITENDKVIYYIDRDFVELINGESVRTKYTIMYITIILLESGTVWIQEMRENWKQLDIPPIIKISRYSSFIVLLDTSKTVWLYEKTQKLKQRNSKPTNLKELFPDMPLIDDIYCCEDFICCKDVDDCIWVYGNNKYKKISISGPSKYENLTKIEYPFIVRNIYPLSKFTVFIDTEWNMWICGENSQVEGEITLITNVRHYLPIPSQAKSARF